MCGRTFRRYLSRFEEDGREGLMDRRLGSRKRTAPVDEVMAMQEQYRQRHEVWNVRHFHECRIPDDSIQFSRWSL
jgi:hypothetical protein